jgi:hypothetical protein
MDNVNHPNHYTQHASGVECIQITEHLSFNLGNAIKYIWRYEDKANPFEDLRKAIWYIDREIERYKAIGISYTKNPIIWDNLRKVIKCEYNYYRELLLLELLGSINIETLKLINECILRLIEDEYHGIPRT